MGDLLLPEHLPAGGVVVVVFRAEPPPGLQGLGAMGPKQPAWPQGRLYRGTRDK